MNTEVMKEMRYPRLNMFMLELPKGRNSAHAFSKEARVGVPAWSNPGMNANSKPIQLNTNNHVNCFRSSCTAVCGERDHTHTHTHTHTHEQRHTHTRDSTTQTRTPLWQVYCEGQPALAVDVSTCAGTMATGSR